MGGILVVGPSWIGDMVMAQSLYTTLQWRRQAPIDVLAPAWSKPVLRRMPEVRRVIELPVAHGELGLRKRWRAGVGMRATRYEQAIVLPRTFKSALAPFFARIPRRTGYRGESRYGLINDMRVLDEARMPLMVQRYVALGYDAGDPIPPPDIPSPRLRVDRENQARLFAELSIAPEPAAVGFVPGAEYGPAKRWPPEHFATLARALVERGYQVWLFGSEKDRPVCRQIARLGGGGITDLSGRTRLEDAIDLIAATAWMVTNDSGLMHIAAATERRLVAIYGSSTPNYTPPLSERAHVMHLGLDCSPCFERECPFGHYRCLQDIRPEAVLSEMA